MRRFPEKWCPLQMIIHPAIGVPPCVETLQCVLLKFLDSDPLPRSVATVASFWKIEPWSGPQPWSWMPWSGWWSAPSDASLHNLQWVSGNQRPFTGYIWAMDRIHSIRFCGITPIQSDQNFLWDPSSVFFIWVNCIGKIFQLICLLQY